VKFSSNTTFTSFRDAAASSNDEAIVNALNRSKIDCTDDGTNSGAEPANDLLFPQNHGPDGIGAFASTIAAARS